MDVAAGFNASLAITRTGSLLSWGSGPLLGRRDDPCVVHSLPRLVEGLEGRKITHAVCGGSHALLLGEGGCVLSYGWGLYGQLGDGLCTSQAIPKEITSLQGEVWTSLSAGPWHSAAVNDEGDIVTWGRGDAGQLGHGDTQSRPEPHLVETMQGKKVKVVACGSRHTVMLTEEGEVFASGWNRYGQLGSGDTTDTLTPRRMATRARAIGCGCWHSLVALDQGDVT